MKILFSLAFLFCNHPFEVHSFLPLIQFHHVAAVKSFPRMTTSLQMSYPMNFERAVECGEKYGLCDVEELDRLAEELEFYHGSFFEKSPELQEKEIQDRKDLAEVLRLEAELLRRQDYLKKANLFKEDVKVFHDMKERDEFVENLDFLDT